MEENRLSLLFKAQSRDGYGNIHQLFKMYLISRHFLFFFLSLNIACWELSSSAASHSHSAERAARMRRRIKE